jgi:hypothetical protein
MKAYSGSCHCGSIRFEADLDLAAGTNRCNCSICYKNRTWFAFAKGAEHFRLLGGKESVSEYRWSPPGRSSFLTFAFCRTCGTRVFARGEMEALGGTFHAVPVTTLDDLPADELAASPVRYRDGRHDQYEQSPADLRLL